MGKKILHVENISSFYQMDLRIVYRSIKEYSSMNRNLVQLIRDTGFEHLIDCLSGLD